MNHARFEKKLPLGIVLRDIDAMQHLVHVVSREPCVVAYEFTYRAPLFKCTPTIKDALPTTRGAIDKFDLYFKEAIAKEGVRAQLKQKFRQDYIRRFPASEASDLFLASGDVFGFSFDLRRPDLLEAADRDAAWVEMQRYPFDADVISTWKKEQTLDPMHLRGEVKLFLDQVENRRRRKLPAVKQVMTGSRSRDPVILEVMVSAGLPGYFIWALAPVVDEVDGALVWLPG